MAIDFDGTDDFIDCGSATSLDNLTQSTVSMAAWVRFDALTGGPAILAKSDASAYRWVFYVTAVGTLGFYVPNTSGTQGNWLGAAGAVTTGTWFHLAMTYNGSVVSNDPILYVNGSVSTLSADTNPTYITDNDAAINMRVARAAAANIANGQFEDVRVFNRILTAKEVASLAAGYRDPLGGEVLWLSLSDAQVVQHWDGDSLATTDILPDMSGNGNDGVPTNTPTARASEAPRFHPGWWNFSGLIGGLAQSVAGTLTSSGALTKQTGKLVAGALTSAGAIIKSISKSLAGTLTSAGGFLAKFTLSRDSRHIVQALDAKQKVNADTPSSTVTAVEGRKQVNADTWRSS